MELSAYMWVPTRLLLLPGCFQLHQLRFQRCSPPERGWLLQRAANPWGRTNTAAHAPPKSAAIPPSWASCPTGNWGTPRGRPHVNVRPEVQRQSDWRRRRELQEEKTVCGGQKEKEGRAGRFEPGYWLRNARVRFAKVRKEIFSTILGEGNFSNALYHSQWITLRLMHTVYQEVFNAPLKTCRVVSIVSQYHIFLI